MRTQVAIIGAGMSGLCMAAKLQDACSVCDDLDGFNAANIVEEPATTGVHKLRVALHLHQLERAHAFHLSERMGLLGSEEAIDVFVATPNVISSSP